MTVWLTSCAAPWADAIPSAQDPKRYLPQAIAHRGYKAKYPENSILAFDAAVDIGAHAIETDVHLTADGVVVMSHVSGQSTSITQLAITTVNLTIVLADMKRSGSHGEAMLWCRSEDQ
jgi:phosphatidylglycerol phospholipase C